MKPKRAWFAIVHPECCGEETGCQLVLALGRHGTKMPLNGGKVKLQGLEKLAAQLCVKCSLVNEEDTDATV